MTVIVGLDRFRVHFRHLSKLTKRPTLHKAPMSVLTTCVVTMESMNEGANWIFRGVAVGHSMCDQRDNFRKDFARDASFNRAVSNCALFRAVKSELIAAYEERKPQQKVEPQNKYSSRSKAAIADFLRQFATESGATPEEAAKILQAAETIVRVGTVANSLTDSKRAMLVLSGARTHDRRATPEGRAEVRAEKRARRDAEIPHAAG